MPRPADIGPRTKGTALILSGAWPGATIADLESAGACGVEATCNDCWHQELIPFGKIELPKGALFQEVSDAGRFVCSTCRSDHVLIVPAWGNQPTAP